MADGTVEAADTLRTLLTVAAPSVRLAAAKALLELGCKYWETLDHEERLQRVEGLIHAQDQTATSRG